MAVVGSNLGGSSALSSSSVNTASINPTANALVLITVTSYINGGTPNAPTLTGNNLTYVQVDTKNSGNYTSTMFRALGGSPNSGAVTIAFGGQTQDSITWEMSQFTGVDTSGANGAGAIVQEVKNFSSGVSTGITVTLAGFSGSDNVTYGFAFVGPVVTITVGGSFSQFDQSSDGNGKIDSVDCWANSNQTSVPFTWASTNVTSVAFGAEIKAFPVATTGEETAFFL